ncbi:male determiner protein Yob [Anopheles arabiensis]|uniref:Male determiner protein Yob n=2 Tax=Anopheles gambiae TaxID=7165 RepID=YOB_ANOGA|nr:male determiner protein Yob [Anopheles arabiensis]P0DP77.1 RecName: Full=Male determiner protein Yob [Anopheles gambiae]
MFSQSACVQVHIKTNELHTAVVEKVILAMISSCRTDNNQALHKLLHVAVCEENYNV